MKIFKLSQNKIIKSHNIFFCALLVRNCCCFSLNNYSNNNNTKFVRFANPVTNIKKFFSTDTNLNKIVKIKEEATEATVEINDKPIIDPTDKPIIKIDDKIPKESYIGRADNAVANSIDNSTTGINFTSTFLSHGIKYSGSMVGITLDGVNNTIVKNLPHVVDIKVPTIIKQTTAGASDLSGHGKDLTK